MKLKRLSILLMFLAPAAFAASGPPAKLSNLGSNVSVLARTNARDGNGDIMSPAVAGYKVFEDSNSASAFLVYDVDGSTPTLGVLHALCIDEAPAAAFAVVVDSASASNVTATGGNSLTGEIQASATAQNCTVYDAQFSLGLVIINSAAGFASHVYWRPTGKQN